MKALLCTHCGTPDDLELADIAEPVPKAGEALERVRAAALNFFDTLIIAGKYQHKPPFPFSPAAEFAGEIESVGAGVTGFVLGDRVLGNIGWGAAREKVAVADVEEEVRRPAVVAVLEQLGQRELENALVERDRLLDVARDERKMMETARRRRRAVSGHHEVPLPKGGPLRRSIELRIRHDR